MLKELGALLGELVSWLPPQWRPTQKFVAHAAATVLTALVVAVLPTGASETLNAAIVILAGLIAHWLVPNAA